MTCWDAVWFQAGRINKEIEALRVSLYADVRMPTDALSNMLGQDIYGTVQTRIAVDGHDVEVKLEDGLWRVLNPIAVQTLSLNASMLHNEAQYDSNILTPTTSNSYSLGDIARQKIRSSG